MNLNIIVALCVSLFCCAQAIKNSNPECTDLKKLQKKAKNTIEKIPGEHLNCKPNKNCTGLICNGKIAGRKFNATVILEGCKEPVGMTIIMNHKRLEVKDGYNKKILSKPLSVLLSVEMKKEYSSVFVTVKMKTCVTSLPSISKNLCRSDTILDKQEIRVHCGSSTTMYSASVIKTRMDTTGKSLSTGIIVAVVVGVVIFFVILVAVIVWIVHRKRQRVARYNNLAMNDGNNPLFLDTEPPIS